MEEALQGDLQRECIDEDCNYEEAREVFENDVSGLTSWWNEKHNPGKADSSNTTGIIIGVVVGVVVLIIIIAVIVGKYSYKFKVTIM